MDVYTMLVQLIGSVGFPIVCCVMMWRQMLTQEEHHKGEMNSITTALNNNTSVLQKLVDRLEVKKDG